MNEFSINSSVGTVHCCLWHTEAAPTGIVHLIHGIKEYAARYDQMAHCFNEKGYWVVASDHPGHGDQAEDLGYMTGGWTASVKMIRALYKEMHGKHPDVPYFMYGHSMGSFLLTTYLSAYESELSGAVISGTGWQADAVVAAGLLVCKAERRRLGEKAHSPLLQKLMFGSYNDHFKPEKIGVEWLSSDETVGQAYIQDSLCNWLPSVQMCEQMLLGIRWNQKRAHLERIRKDLPLFFIAGQEDPVGNYGNGVLKAVQLFKNAGLEDVVVELYPNMRHECHNEMNRETVFTDVLNWMDSKR